MSVVVYVHLCISIYLSVLMLILISTYIRILKQFLHLICLPAVSDLAGTWWSDPEAAWGGSSGPEEAPAAAGGGNCSADWAEGAAGASEPSQGGAQTAAGGQGGRARGRQKSLQASMSMHIGHTDRIEKCLLDPVSLFNIVMFCLY